MSYISKDDDYITVCGHCNGTGTCNRGYGSGGGSCNPCISATGQNPNLSMHVRCDVCNGTGKARI